PVLSCRYSLSLHDALPIWEKLAVEIDRHCVVSLCLPSFPRSREPQPHRIPHSSEDARGRDIVEREQRKFAQRLAFECHFHDTDADRKSTRLNSSHVAISYA